MQLIRSFFSGLLRRVTPRNDGKGGLSLAESVIALGLLGIVLVPILMMSSSWFLTSLMKDRENLGINYGASQFLNQLSADMTQTSRLQANSTTTQLYYAYYDPIQQTEIQRGYQLVTNGSGALKLQRLVYANNAWTAQTSFNEEASDFLAVPNGTTFKYCADTTCTTASSAEDAVFIRLAGWQFYTKTSAGGSRVLTLPTTDIYLAAGSVGEVLLSEKPRQLSSFTGISAFGSNANLLTAFVSSTNNKLVDIYTPIAASAGLTTIVSNRPYPGGGDQNADWYNLRAAIAIDSTTGRVFFGENNNPGNFYTWTTTTGLSTLVSGRNKPGFLSTLFDSVNSRVFFGEAGSPGNFYTWSVTTGLSTLMTNQNAPATKSIYANTSTGRIYFGSTTNFYTWLNSTGLSTIASGLSTPGGNNAVGIQNSTDRVFFGENTRFYTWTLASGLSTLLDSRTQPGYSQGIQVDQSTGRVFIGENSATGNFWTWLGSSGLSTLLSGRNKPGMGSSTIDPLTGRVFWGDNGPSANFYTWTVGTGLSTLLSSVPNPGYQSNGMDPTTGRVFMGCATGYTCCMATWLSSTGLSTLTAPEREMGYANMYINSSNGRAYFGGEKVTYTWSSSTGLSTIASSAGAMGLGQTGAAVNPSTERITMAMKAPWIYDAALVSWSSSTGLSTIVSARTGPGSSWAIKQDTVSGRVFFGENETSDNFYAWAPTSTVSGSAIVADFLGTPTNQNRTVSTTASASYGAATEDIANNLYLLNTTSKTLERYTYSTATSQFSLSNSLAWTTWATTVGAVTPDQSGNSVALLDTGNKQIDVYSDRTVNGTPSAPTAYSISGTTTPTGLVQSPRTGNYLVLDSALQSSTNVRLFVYNSTGTLQNTYTIDVTSANLTPAATTETNFKIQYNDRENILYLIAPNVGSIYALTLPKYL